MLARQGEGQDERRHRAGERDAVQISDDLHGKAPFRRGKHCPASEVFPETAHCNPVRAGFSAFPTGKAKFCLVSTPTQVYNVYRKRLSAGEVCLHGRDNEGE